MSGPSTELYRSENSAIGTWLCRPTDKEFPGGWIENPTIAFPRTCVRIRQEGEEPIVADPNVAVIYRGSQEYSRTAVDPAGDRCDWFEVGSDLAEEVARQVHDNGAGGGSPMGQTHAPVPSDAYLLLRVLLRHVVSPAGPDPLVVEETLLQLLERVLTSANRAGTELETTRPDHRYLVEDAKAFMALNFRAPLSLADVGRAIGASRFHLARLFRAVTGETIHSHITDLRLRAALGELEGGCGDIARIALDLGFASHSHLTKVFRQRFGMTPSEFRDQADLSKIVTA